MKIGIAALTFALLTLHAESAKCVVTYTFDDGLADQYTLAYPMFRKAGLPATFFIIGSKVGDPRGMRNKAERHTPVMTWEQIRDMSTNGMEIASHGWAHAKYAKMSRDEILDDIRHNQSALKENAGVDCVSFASPFNAKKGADGSNVEALAQKAGLRAIRLKQKGVGGKMTAEKMNSLVESAKKKGEWLVFMIHGISRGYDAWENPLELEKHLSWVKEQKDVEVQSFAAAAKKIGSRTMSTTEAIAAYEGTAEAARPRTFEIGEREFLLDGKPFLVRCGEVHYARIPREYWGHRLKMLRAMGCNAVGCYMFWNFHEREKGVFNWKGRADAAAFCRMAQKEGLWVILRPGPYSCAEWEGGGAPWWLMGEWGTGNGEWGTGRPISMRSSDPRWVVPATNWLHAVGRELASLQVTRGGPILMVQVENEYGLHGNDVGYIRALRQSVINAGFEVPLYACNPPRVIQNGFVPELFQAANFGADPEQRFEIVRKYQPKGPLMCAEYYPAWFDTWGQSHHPPKSDRQFFGPIDWMFAHRVSFSLYMAHGGTSFGGWTGCRNPFVPNVTSYDYEAPINEHGRANPSFAKYRARAANYLNPGETIPDVPAPIPVKAYGTVALSPFAETIDCGGDKARLEQPVYSERLGMGFGLIVWSAEIPVGVAGDLKAENLHDFGYVHLDGKRIGILDRRHRGIKIKIPSSSKVRKLSILVEAMGRINSSSGMEDRKGLDGRVFVGKTEIKNWEYGLEPIDPDGQENPPGNWRGTFAVDEIADTFVDMRAFNKGIVWVNGKNLGRYWKIGPQQTLYMPGCWLKKGTNEIVVREMLEPTGEPIVAFLDHPILDELHPEADFNIVKREHDKFVGGDEVASGAFSNTDAAQVVMLEKPVRGTFFTLQILSTYDAKNLASIAEFDFLGADGNPITSIDMQISGVDSEEEVRDDGIAENAIDGQVEAYWISSSRTLPHWIEIRVSDQTEIHGFRYTPRQGNGIGKIKDWKLHAR
jgi:beta-galactosidase